MTEQLISSNVTLGQVNELAVLRVHNKRASASIALQGAHIYEFTPVNGDNLLFVSTAETFEAGSAIRGGIPVCWPWFGPHTKNKTAPAHGLVRDVNWQYEVISDHDARTDIKFWFETTGDNANFPYRARVELLASIGDTLVVSLTTSNLDDQPFLISQALHTYFKCKDVADVRLHGLAGACFLDKLTSENRYVPTEFRFDQEIDWVLQEPGAPVGFTGLGHANIKLTRLGSRSLVIWNPWVEKSKTLSHFQADDYRQMFCVETGNVSEDSRLIKPKQNHVMLMELGHG